MDRYYTVKEVANLLELSPNRVRYLIHNGFLKAKIGPRLRFLIHENYLFNYVYHDPKHRDMLRRKIPEFGIYEFARNLELEFRNGFHEYRKKCLQRFGESF